MTASVWIQSSNGIEELPRGRIGVIIRPAMISMPTPDQRVEMTPTAVRSAGIRSNTRGRFPPARKPSWSKARHLFERWQHCHLFRRPLCHRPGPRHDHGRSEPSTIALLFAGLGPLRLPPPQVSTHTRQLLTRSLRSSASARFVCQAAMNREPFVARSRWSL